MRHCVEPGGGDAHGCRKLRGCTTHQPLRGRRHAQWRRSRRQPVARAFCALRRSRRPPVRLLKRPASASRSTPCSPTNAMSTSGIVIFQKTDNGVCGSSKLRCEAGGTIYVLADARLRDWRRQPPVILFRQKVAAGRGEGCHARRAASAGPARPTAGTGSATAAAVAPTRPASICRRRRTTTKAILA